MSESEFRLVGATYLCAALKLRAALRVAIACNAVHPAFTRKMALFPIFRALTSDAPHHQVAD